MALPPDDHNGTADLEIRPTNSDLPMIHVHIHNEQSHMNIDEPFLIEVVEQTLTGEGISDAEISLAIVDDASIHQVNREHLQHDYPTDVISFRLDEPNEDFSIPGESTGFEGEIVISAETAARRAGEFDWSPAEEVVLYLVHGLLHLAGYDDRTPDDRRRMQEAEISNLSRWNLTPRYDDAPSSPDGASGKTADPSAEGEPS